MSLNSIVIIVKCTKKQQKASIENVELSYKENENLFIYTTTDYAGSMMNPIFMLDASSLFSNMYKQNESNKKKKKIQKETWNGLLLRRDALA